MTPKPSERKVFGNTAEAAIFWSIATLAAFWVPAIQFIRKVLAHD